MAEPLTEIPPDLVALGAGAPVSSGASSGDVPEDLLALGAGAPISETPVDLAEQAKALEAKKTLTERAAEALTSQERLFGVVPSPEEVTAGLEAYGRATLPVAYQYFERAVGVPREEQERREQENPLASALGTVGGIGASLLTGTEAAQGLLGGAATVLAPAAALTSRTGAVVRAGLESAAPSVAKTILGKTVTGATAGAIEAGILGSLIEADEASLKDRKMSGESIAHSMLWGSGLGAALSGVPASVAAIGETGAGKWLSKSLGKSEFSRILKNLGVTKQDIAIAREQIGPQGLPAVISDAADFGLTSPFMSAEKSIERSKQMMEQSGKVIGEYAKEADARLTQELAPKVDDLAEKISDKVISKYADDFHTKDVAEKIAEYVDDLKKRFQGPMKLSDVHELRKELDKPLFGPFGERVPTRSPLAEAWRDVRGVLTNEINQGLERVGIEKQGWSVPQRQYQVASTIRRYAQDVADQAQAVKPDAIQQGLGALGFLLKGPIGYVVGTASKKAPGLLADTGGWLAGAMKNALEANAPKAVLNDLQAFNKVRSDELLAKVPGPALSNPDLGRLEHLRMHGVIQQAQKDLSSIPNVNPQYVEALNDVQSMLYGSYSPNMSPAFAAKKLEEAERALTPFAALSKGRTRFQQPAADVIRGVRDAMRESLAQSDAWGVAYRDAAAKRIAEASARLIDPKRVSALQSLEEMTTNLNKRISDSADQLMGVSGSTTRQLLEQKRQQNKVNRVLKEYIPGIESEE